MSPPRGGFERSGCRRPRRVYAIGARSEAVLQPELERAPVVGRRDLAERRGPDGVAGPPVDDLVEHVEALEAQLELVPAVRAEAEVLEQRQVGAIEARPAHDVAALVARD